MSGSEIVAAIEFAGSYTSTNFHVTSGKGGVVEITDPIVPSGGSVTLSATGTFPRNGIDLPNIRFGAQTTLAYAANVAGTGGTLTVSDGRDAASIAPRGNYIAGSFVAAADGQRRHSGDASTTAATAVADASASVTMVHRWLGK